MPTLALYLRVTRIFAATNYVLCWLALFAVTAFSPSALAQRTIAFESFDADADGRLSIFEFGQLPGLHGSLDRFVELDRSRDRFLSREEWQAGSPDESGIPVGSDAIARMPGARPGTPPSLSRHGRTVPLLPANADKPQANVPALSAAERGQLLTGRGGADGQKRPPPPPAIQPTPPAIPPELRPPAR